MIEIVRDPERRSGHPIICGTRTAVHDIVARVKLYDGDIELACEQELPHLTVRQIREVMTWYESNREEIDQILRERQEDYERAATEQGVRRCFKS